MEVDETTFEFNTAKFSNKFNALFHRFVFNPIFYDFIDEINVIGFSLTAIKLPDKQLPINFTCDAIIERREIFNTSQMTAKNAYNLRIRVSAPSAPYIKVTQPSFLSGRDRGKMPNVWMNLR